jgi:hypothetical protein
MATPRPLAASPPSTATSSRHDPQQVLDAQSQREVLAVAASCASRDVDPGAGAGPLPGRATAVRVSVGQRRSASEPDPRRLGSASSTAGSGPGHVTACAMDVRQRRAGSSVPRRPTAVRGVRAASGLALGSWPGRVPVPPSTLQRTSGRSDAAKNITSVRTYSCENWLAVEAGDVGDAAGGWFACECGVGTVVVVSRRAASRHAERWSRTRWRRPIRRPGSG